ncbi:MAG: class I SAM-dependent methyltransferase [Candidatus Bathyarchaeota archaeon]|nr:class I SAM-dependent methyltransferase [Candidatus Bathyarchaeota archaeon]
MASWKEKRQQRNLYNRTAHIYDLRYEDEQRSKFTAVLNNLNVDSDSLVLDLGCGTGLLLSKLRGAREIVGLDISREMLHRAKLIVGCIENIHLVLGDADNIPLRCSHFDLVFAITLLQNMPNPSSTLQEIKRITKPNALINVTGLKIHFPEDCFAELLKVSRMKAKFVMEKDNVKCHIAICKKNVEAG